MKEIPGFVDYFIDKNGDVFSYRGIGRKPKRRIVPLTLKAVIVRGYKSVGLMRNGKNEKHYIHALVLLAFVSPCPEGYECQHLDGNKMNNRLKNLKWGTYQENQLDREKHGTTNRGEKQGRSKLTSEDVHKIRRLARGGKIIGNDHGSCYAWIAKKFNVSKSNIAQIMRKKSWFWLEER